MLWDDAAIERVAAGLVDRTLPKAEWTHAGHFAAALWLLRHRPEAATPAALRVLIKAYNEATGTANADSSGYHHTITIASLRAAAAHLGAAGAGASLAEVLERVMASAQGRSDWLLAHWSHDRLFTPAARREWVAPDLAPLPF